MKKILLCIMDGVGLTKEKKNIMLYIMLKLLI